MSFSETGKHGNHISIGKADQPDTQVHGRVKDTVKIKGISEKIRQFGVSPGRDSQGIPYGV